MPERQQLNSLGQQPGTANSALAMLHPTPVKHEGWVPQGMPPKADAASLNVQPKVQPWVKVQPWGSATAPFVLSHPLPVVLPLVIPLSDLPSLVPPAPPGGQCHSCCGGHVHV